MANKFTRFFSGLARLIKDPEAFEKDRVALADITYRAENDRQLIQYKNEQIRISGTQNLVAQVTLRDHLRELAHEAARHYTPQQIYQALAALDPHGYTLYHTAEEILNVNPEHVFYAEDCQGRFEVSDGIELLNFTEVAKFAEIEWSQQRNYEYMSSFSLDTTTPQYLQYREELWGKAVDKLFNDITQNFNNNNQSNMREALRTMTQLSTGTYQGDLTPSPVYEFEADRISTPQSRGINPFEEWGYEEELPTQDSPEPDLEEVELE